MKKLIPILLVVLLMVGLMPLGAYAVNEGSVTFTWNGNNQALDISGFSLLADPGGESGWPVGGSRNLKIMDSTNAQPITRIEAVVSAGGENCGKIQVDYGVMQQDGNTVTVTNINNTSCFFTSNNTEPVEFSKITVYYTPHEHCYVCKCGEVYKPGSTASTLSEGNLAIIVGVAAAVVFGLGGFLIGKKKKPTAEE